MEGGQQIHASVAPATEQKEQKPQPAIEINFPSYDENYFYRNFFVFKSILFIMAYSSKKYEVVQLWSKKEGKINGQLQTMKS